MKNLLNKEDLPDWFNYSSDFLKIVEQGLLDFDPWIILQKDRLRTRFEGLKKRYPNRDLVPFACREDNDDVACWDKAKKNKVVIVHDFASPGWEESEEFNSFKDWVRNVLEITINR